MKKRPRSDWVYAALREAIIQGALRAGVPLAEASIANEFGVSRVPVREALARLKEAGLAQQKKNGRSVVTGFTLAELREILFVRQVLEVASVELACSAGHDRRASHLPHLRSILKDEEFVLGRGEVRDQYKVNLAFHLGIVDLAGNHHLKNTILVNLDQIQIALACSPHMPENLATSHEMHTQLLDAVEAADSARAVALMKRHLAATEENIAAAMASKPAGGLKAYAHPDWLENDGYSAP